jgi:hypothetical protein
LIKHLLFSIRKTSRPVTGKADSSAPWEVPRHRDPAFKSLRSENQGQTLRGEGFQKLSWLNGSCFQQHTGLQVPKDKSLLYKSILSPLQSEQAQKAQTPGILTTNKSLSKDRAIQKLSLPHGGRPIFWRLQSLDTQAGALPFRVHLSGTQRGRELRADTHIYANMCANTWTPLPPLPPTTYTYTYLPILSQGSSGRGPTKPCLACPLLAWQELTQPLFCGPKTWMNDL